jgi:hypothetical protein
MQADIYFKIATIRLNPETTLFHSVIEETVGGLVEGFLAFSVRTVEEIVEGSQAAAPSNRTNQVL